VITKGVIARRTFADALEKEVQRQMTPDKTVTITAELMAEIIELLREND
jgi:hypothetical protein